MRLFRIWSKNGLRKTFLSNLKMKMLNPAAKSGGNAKNAVLNGKASSVTGPQFEDVVVMYVPVNGDIGINDLWTTHPELCKEWSSRNGELLPEQYSRGSNVKVWWQCENGHEWEAYISSRVQGNGCPICARAPLIKGVNDLRTTNPEIIKLWSDKNDDLTPDDIRASYRKQVWWKCSQCGNEYLAQPHSVISRKGIGCKRCQSTIGRYWKGILTEEEYIKEEYR